MRRPLLLETEICFTKAKAKTGFYGSRSCEKSENFVATFGRKLSSKTLFVHARYGATKSFVHGTGGMRRRIGHSREDSHVLEGISRCQNLQGRAHLSQQAAANGRWSVRLDQHQDKLDYSYDAALTRVLRSFSGCRTDGVTVVQNNDVRCVDVSVWRGVPF